MVDVTVLGVFVASKAEGLDDGEALESEPHRSLEGR